MTNEWNVFENRENESQSQALLCLCFWFHSKAGWERFCMDFCKRNTIKQAKYKCLHDWAQIDASVNEAYWRHAHQRDCLGGVQMERKLLKNSPNMFGSLQRIMPPWEIKSLD